MDDLELLERLRRQDQRGLEEAIHRYAGYVTAVARRTLGSFGAAEDAEELASDAFVALWRNAGSLRDDSSLRSWLAVVVRNAALKRLGRTRLEEPLEENLLLPWEEDGPEKLAERRLLCRQALDSLDPESRDIFLRHYFWYQGVEEIARETGKSVPAVKARLRRGRERLREKLEKEDCAP